MPWVRAGGLIINLERISYMEEFDADRHNPRRLRLYLTHANEYGDAYLPLEGMDLDEFLVNLSIVKPDGMPMPFED